MAHIPYAEFLASKTRDARSHGCPDISVSDVHPLLRPWQARLVAWAAHTGRAALWADTGLGKTLMQLEWARLVGGPALIVAPLAVCRQTAREAAKLGIDARVVRDPDEPAGDIAVTNIEMLHRFDPTRYRAVVLDESSLLKQSTGKTRNALIAWARSVPLRLACSATPAPNDPEELTSQAEWLGVMSRVEMLAAFFVHDDTGWRPKGHAVSPMYRWMSTWATALRRPSDLGDPDGDFDLPGLNIRTHLVETNTEAPEGQMFRVGLSGVGDRAKIRRSTVNARCVRVNQLVQAEPDEPWVLWCGLNDEAKTLTGLIPGAVEVRGSMTPEEKADRLLAFADGHIRILVTKPSIAGFGMNWQHCARTAFVGLSDSYETYYQSIRRFHRHGQTRQVHAHIVLSESERLIAANVARKADISERTIAGLVDAMRTTNDIRQGTIPCQRTHMSRTTPKVPVGI